MKETDIRFCKKVQISKKCWTWTSAVMKTYGWFNSGKKSVFAHRYAFEMINGPIPEGFEIDHLCKNRLCIKPSHLEAVTKQENIARSNSPSEINRRKTQCIKGHLLPKDRICKVCKAAYQRQYIKKWRANRS